MLLCSLWTQQSLPGQQLRALFHRSPELSSAPQRTAASPRGLHLRAAGKDCAGGTHGAGLAPPPGRVKVAHHLLYQGQELHSTRRISSTAVCKHAVSRRCQPLSPVACLMSQTISKSLFMNSPTYIPLPREGTNIDSLNYYPGVQERSGQGKAERVLCAQRCPRYIPGNRTRLVPSPEPLRRGATTW